MMRLALFWNNYASLDRALSDADHSGNWYCRGNDFSKGPDPHLRISGSRLVVLGETKSKSKNKSSWVHQRAYMTCKENQVIDGLEHREQLGLGTLYVPLKCSRQFYVNSPALSRFTVHDGEMLFVHKSVPRGELVYTRREKPRFKPMLMYDVLTDFMEPKDCKVSFPPPPTGYWPKEYYEWLTNEEAYEIMTSIVPVAQEVMRLKYPGWKEINEELAVRFAATSATIQGDGRKGFLDSRDDSFTYQTDTSIESEEDKKPSAKKSPKKKDSKKGSRKQKSRKPKPKSDSDDDSDDGGGKPKSKAVPKRKAGGSSGGCKCVYICVILHMFDHTFVKSNICSIT